MEGKRPWRLIGATGLMLLAGLLALPMTSIAEHRLLFWIDLIIWFAAISWMVFEIFSIGKNTMRYVARMNRTLDRTMQTTLTHMPVPLVIADSHGEILWYNDPFVEMVNGGDMFGMQMEAVTGIYSAEILSGESMEMVLQGRNYKVFRTDYDRRDGRMALYTFEDIDSYVLLRQNYMQSRSCVLLIHVDNFEDLFAGTRQSERAAVLASLEKLFEKMLNNTHSIFHHLDEDRFLVVTEAQYCMDMERLHFPILDAARKIKVRGRICLTLSIGVGRSGKNLEENEHFAQLSLDMALGRGGDQAAVKTDNGFTFYGGVSQGIEHRNKAKNRAIAKDLIRLMSQCSHVYIMGHRASDLDAVGAAVGIAFIAEQKGIPHNIVVRTETTLAYLLTDRIAEEMPGCMMTPEMARANITDSDLLIIVDTFSKDIVEDAELYRMAKHVVVIDHHRKMVNYLDNTTLKLHDPHASSAAELVAGMIQYFDWRSEMSQFCAEALMAGIMLDTKNFVMQTGVHTFEVAAYLREQGADPISVKTLFAESLEAYQHRSKLVSEAKVYGKYVIAVAEEEVPDMRVIAAQVADELLGVESVCATFVVFNTKNQACISARSLGKMNVQVIMEQLGGGGHQIMAATQRTDCTVHQLRDMLIAVLDTMDASPEETDKVSADSDDNNEM
ncbi:MAG: DHH family phosphoesterase [Oscillospiraceae bacterium]|nr:DHH family phosphoesterase [Oscillospiraceae bacterium]